MSKLGRKVSREQADSFFHDPIPWYFGQEGGRAAEVDYQLQLAAEESEPLPFSDDEEEDS